LYSEINKLINSVRNEELAHDRNWRVGSCECGDEPSGSKATEFVRNEEELPE
jgi:hypothetical protein